MEGLPNVGGGKINYKNPGVILEGRRAARPRSSPEKKKTRRAVAWWREKTENGRFESGKGT